jgi:hypothetical protein
VTQSAAASAVASFVQDYRDAVARIRDAVARFVQYIGIRPRQQEKRQVFMTLRNNRHNGFGTRGVNGFCRFTLCAGL